EAALGGGVILLARDGCFRDMASMHGTYRKVDETVPAIRLLGQVLSVLRPSLCHWFFDSRLATVAGFAGPCLKSPRMKNGTGRWIWRPIRMRFSRKRRMPLSRRIV